MRIVALAFALTLALPVAAPAQYNPYTDTWEGLDFDTPSRDYSGNPALDDAMDQLDREQWRSTMRALEERAWAEKFRLDGLRACAGITLNPAAAEACRRRLGY